MRLHTGNEMPVLGLGTWELTRDTAGTVCRAFELGYRMIDTAADYGSQPGIGEAMRRSALEREAVYLVAKVEENEDAYDATRRNLDDIGCDHADLMLIHRPPPQGAGVPLWEGLIRARQDGLALDIGVSNYTMAQIRELFEATGEMPAVNQIEWTPFGYEDEMLVFCRRAGVVLQAYSPLTRGLRLDDGRIGEIASRYARTPAQLLIRWNIERGTVPLPKANDHGHLEENIGGFDFEIGPDDIEALNAMNEHYSSLGVLPYV